MTFADTNFTKCKSKVHEKIGLIKNESENIESEEDQKRVSKKLRNLTNKSSGLLSSGDIQKISNIIDTLIDFSERNNTSGLNEEVTADILMTVDRVLKSTNDREISQDYHVASSMRSSVEKLAKKIAEGSEDGTIYKKEQTVGIVISKTTTNGTSFTISGDANNLTETRLTDSAESENSVLFSVTVPANDQRSPVTAVLYESPKCYPEEETVENFTFAFVQQFIYRSHSKRLVSKVVSLAVEIKYASSTESVDFEAGKMIKMHFVVKEEIPRVHYKMALKSSYQCAFYNTSTEVWVTGDESRCTTTVEVGRSGTTSVFCQCSHMTTFAVLMSFISDYDPLEGTVTSILLGISLGCLFFAIVAYLPAKKMLQTRSVRLNLLLFSSLICSIITFYFMEHVVLTETKAMGVPLETDTASTPCFVVAFLMNYFWLCQMAWMVCEAVVIYRALVSDVMSSHIHRYMLKFNLVCWGVPLIFPIAGIIWGQQELASPKTCFLRKKYGLVTFYGPIVLCNLFNILTFIRITWSVFGSGNKETGKIPVSDMERRKRQLKFATTVMTLLGVSWILGFFLIIDGDNTIWIRWLFIIFNSTQGIFIFILYVVLNKDLRMVWRGLLKNCGSAKASHHRTPAVGSKGKLTNLATMSKNTKNAIKMDKLATLTSAVASKTSEGFSSSLVTNPAGVEKCEKMKNVTERYPMTTATTSTPSTTSQVSKDRSTRIISPKI